MRLKFVEVKTADEIMRSYMFFFGKQRGCLKKKLSTDCPPSSMKLIRHGDKVLDSSLIPIFTKQSAIVLRLFRKFLRRLVPLTSIAICRFVPPF